MRGIRPEGEVLEVGAGVGAVAAHLLQTTPGLRMVVTDYDPAMVAVAQRSLRRFSQRVVVACADARDLPFDDDRFDLVVSLAMLHHTGDWRRAVGEAIRVLRPGGRLVGYDLLEGAMLHRRRRPGTMIRPGQLEEILASLPVADARIRPALRNGAVRFFVTKNSLHGPIEQHACRRVFASNAIRGGRNIGTKTSGGGPTGGSFSDVPRRLDPPYRWILFGCSSRAETHSPDPVRHIEPPRNRRDCYFEPGSADDLRCYSPKGEVPGAKCSIPSLTLGNSQSASSLVRFSRAVADGEEAKLVGGGLSSRAEGREAGRDGRSGPRVLVVDDEESITDLVRMALRYAGFQVEVARSGRAALTAATSFRPHLIVLDVMLPDVDGFEVQRRLAADRLRVPILFLTARAETEAKVHGLTMGADDYVTKPFSVEELVARVHVVLRRSGQAEQPARLEFADLEMDEDTHEVWRGGAPLELSPTEFNLLRYLLLNARRVVSKAQIVDHVWRYDFGGDPRIVENYIGYLRKKVDFKEPRLIHTVRGVGYSLRLPR